MEMEVKQRVREFYNSIGWKEIGAGVYQNAQYEDLRPVSRGYIHRCHLRVARFLPSEGTYLLDAGSGPIQYPEYLEYSKGFQYRVCLDISSLALMEARKRIGEHGLYVVGDIARLPFKPNTFDGLVSLHTIHHLPAEEQEKAFYDLYRTLRPGGQAAVVYSWGDRSILMRKLQRPMRWVQAIGDRLGLDPPTEVLGDPRRERDAPEEACAGTFTYKHDYVWVKENLHSLDQLRIRVWRSVSTKFLRIFIHEATLGRLMLWLLFGLEGLFPRLLGRIGQYPLLLFEKSES
jgi:SAM-dependent methyltransferase